MVGKAVILAFAALATAIPIDTNQQAASGAPATANVTVRTLPATLYTVVEGVDRTLDDRTASAHADPQEGDRVEAAQIIGRVGMSGYAGVPHIHFNLITGPKWLAARGLPALFSGFERIRMGGRSASIAETR
jgi:hypothetical protein